MIKFNITTEEIGGLFKVHVKGEVKGSMDIVAMEIVTLLDKLEETCPQALMAAIRNKVHDND